MSAHKPAPMGVEPTGTFDQHRQQAHDTMITPGSGSIAQGDHGVAAGERGVAVGGDVTASLIVTGDYYDQRISYHLLDLDKADNDQLKHYSASTRSLLQDTASFSVGSTPVRVTRSAVETLHTMAASGSVIITGAPGIGKSGVLLDWLHRLDAAQTDYVFLAAVNIEAHDSAHVRIPATISQDLVDLLLKWPGTEPAYLVIDALDGAKDNRTADTLVNLIKRLLQRSSRWRVVVSIREFDLGHHDELRALFKGQPAPSAHHKDYPNVRHIYINEFDETELQQVVIKAPQLAALLLQQESPLAKLLKVPFNLRLAADLLDAGIALDELSPIQSQIQLLDRFWTTRVLRPTDKADARNLLLRRCVEAMIQQRTLRCDRHAIAHAADDGVIINDLLSCHILANWRPSDTVAPEHDVLTFSHHILFDYAVARLLFRGADHSWIERTVHDSQLIFIAYPSYVYHFHHLWHRHPSRTAFWQTVYRSFHTAELSEISRTVGPTVAAELAKTITDLEPLLASLTGLSLQERTAAERALPHLIGSLEAEPALLTNQHTLWSTVAERLSAMLRPTTVYSLNTLIQLFIHQPEHWSNFHWQPISTAARALFQFAWTAHTANIQLIDQAITAVCVTYKVEPTSARALLSRLIEPAHLAEHGYHALIPVADSIGVIAATDPDFARQVYAAIFAFVDERNDTVRFGGPIMSITVTKSQQFDTVQYTLAQQYEHILPEAPALGAQILVNVLNSYPRINYKREGVTFFFREQETKIRFPLESNVYLDDEEVRFAHEAQITMLTMFNDFLCKYVGDEQGMQICQQMVHELAGQTLPMILVHKLLKSATRHPATLGMEMRDFAWAIPLLIHDRMFQASAEFISAVYPRLEPQEQEQIESTILSIPKHLSTQDQEHAKFIQNYLLSHLVPAKLVSEHARSTLIAFLQDQTKGEHHQTDVEQHEFDLTGLLDNMFGPYHKEAAKKAILENEPNYQAINSIQQTIDVIAPNFSNMLPSDAQVQSLLNAIAALQTLLSAQSQTGEHAIIANNAQSAIAQAASIIAHWSSLLDHPDVADIVLKLLLSAAKRPEPAVELSSVDDVTQTTNRHRPGARAYAAHGLLRLAKLPGYVDADVIDALRTLANDPLPSVRIQIAEHIHRLETTSPKLMWEILAQRATVESDPMILRTLLQWPLSHLQAAHGERIVPLVQTIASSIRDAKDRTDIIDPILWIYLQQYLIYQSAAAQQLLFQITDHPHEYHSLAMRLPFRLRESSKHDPSSSIAAQQRSELFNRLISSTCRHYETCTARLAQRPQEQWTKAEQQLLHDLLKLANHFGPELSSLSGSFHNNSINQTNPNDNPARLSEQMQYFWYNHHQSIRQLADLGLPSLTHHMLKILDFMTPLEPVQVFLLFHDALSAAADNGYQYEKMGANLALKIVNKYLSEYKAIFQQDPACGLALLAVLDILLKSGWPETRKLAHQISKVYR